VEGYQFTDAFRNRKWDGKKHFFNLRNKAMPAGLVPMVVAAIKAHSSKAKVMVVDERQQSAPAIARDSFDLEGIDFGLGKYDYQLGAAEAMVEGQQGIIKVATNGGKTEIAAAVIKHLRVPTLFLVERLELLHQTRKRFAKRLCVPEDSIGLIGDGRFSVGDWITVATPASLKSRIDKRQVDPTLWDALFCDECHHVAADTFFAVLAQLTAFYRFGMSGTPLDRSDGADLKLLAQTGPVLYEVSNKLLVERGISVPPHVEMVKIDKPVMPTSGLKWSQVEKMGVTENPHLNEVVVERALEHAAAGRQVLVLVEKVKHGNALAKDLRSRIKGRKSQVEFISGKESTEVRAKALRAYEAGEVTILLATTILDEGVDVPCIDVLILAAGGKAKIRLLQRVGRGLRTGDEKQRLLVIDFANFSHKWLLKHSLTRLRTYKAEECFMISAA
jgi:superfamily II DNA or RNA helicase